MYIKKTEQMSPESLRKWKKKIIKEDYHSVCHKAVCVEVSFSSITL